MATARFSPGRLVTTPGVLAQVPANEVLLALATFTPYVSLWVAQTQVLPDVEVLLNRHHQGCWGEASPEQQRANRRNLRRQRGHVVSVFYSARNHRLRFVSDLSTRRTLVSADHPHVSGGT